MSIGESIKRVDAFDKVTGRAKYTEDFVDRHMLVAKVFRSDIAHGFVKHVDTAEAMKLDGIVRIFTCFDVPENKFPTAGHPWSTDPAHQDVADRHLLNQHVRYYGDDVAVVVAENQVAADQAIRAIRVEYEILPFVLDPVAAMQDGAPKIHPEEGFSRNILQRSDFATGDYDAAVRKAEADPEVVKVEGWYSTPIVQHCHIENHICYSYAEAGKQVVVSSTQIPHIVRRIVGQATGLPWGSVRIIKPYIGGGFGNKQDALYEPLCAWLSMQLGGRAVKIDMTREETFISNRVRHAIQYHFISYVRKNGEFVARSMEGYANQGAYASHGHGIVAKSTNAFRQLYPSCENVKGEVYTIYTNTPSAGAMRGYGIPQISFALESHMDDIARAINMAPLALREKNLMPVGYTDSFSKNVNFCPSHLQCVEKGKAYIDYEAKRKAYAAQGGPVRRGVGMSLFWYNTAVWPISLESSSCRMVLNQDGSIQLQLGETEIGQGADTVFAQMAAAAIGIPVSAVHVISTQDTDISPFGTGAYGSRQTYVGGMAIRQTAEALKAKILIHAREYTRYREESLDIRDGNIVYKHTGNCLMRLSELATEALYSTLHSEHITAEETCQIKTNAYSFGCAFAEVEVDIPLCKIKLLNLINVHDCGRLINPALAEAQVHGGMSMAIGYGLLEQLLFDPKNGRPLNPNLLDYKLSTMMDHPHLEAQFVENYEPTSAWGTKALGEPPACPGAPAIRNAILNATGVAVNDLPINPHRLFARFREEGLV